MPRIEGPDSLMSWEAGVYRVVEAKDALSVTWSLVNGGHSYGSTGHILTLAPRAFHAGPLGLQAVVHYRGDVDDVLLKKIVNIRRQH